ncbi:MAG: NADP-dependent phosphogluconate dehydrogenase [Clostridiales bacterium]|nr:NADP-dependent phosphogluconate dehydrogenase [Clostridiales bacterium]
MKHDIGVYGLGHMGSALVRNLAGKGISVAAYSRDTRERESLHDACPEAERSYAIAHTPEDFIASLCVPRRILLMITAGAAVDQVLHKLLPMLTPGDTVIDGGNSWYRDTLRRGGLMQKHGIHYLGAGISGGERGALEGPSIIAGGDRQGWELCADILCACAANVEGASCCCYLGPGGAGHYVKMVHNGIEYGILQLIAETWMLMENLRSRNDDQIADCFKLWRRGKLSSYLIDAAAAVLGKRAEDGEPLVRKILDEAEQHGTGKWTVLEGIERSVYIPTIYEALSMRNHSARHKLRQSGQAVLSLAPLDIVPFFSLIDDNDIRDALYAAMLICYSQGLELLYAASLQFAWNLSLSDIVDCWKAGCVIRADMLYPISKALPDAYQGNLLLSSEFRPLREEAALRLVSVGAEATGLSVPALSASLNYYDACRAGKMPVNLIQGMRDHFGAHGFRRVDREGLFHGEWDE